MFYYIAADESDLLDTIKNYKVRKGGRGREEGGREQGGMREVRQRRDRRRYIVHDTHNSS